MALVRNLMPEEQQPRNYTLTGYPSNIWGYSADEQGASQGVAAGPTLSSGSMWSRSSHQVASLPAVSSGSTSAVASRSPSGVSLGPAPVSYGVASVGTAPSSLVSGPSSTSSSPNASTSNSIIDDELILTAIVVKNIPFAIKKEQLIEVMTQLGLPLPYAFNYHFDNGVFRGLAFANFSTPEETAVVISNLNGREIGGRKLRVEYKKMLPAQERERIEREKRERRGQLEEQHVSRSTSPVAAATAAAATTQHPALQQESVQHHRSPRSPERPDFNDPETLEIYSSLLLFQADAARLELPLGPNISSSQIRIVQMLAGQMQLHYTLHEALGLTISKAGVGRVDYPSPLFRAAAAASATPAPHRVASATELHQAWSAAPAAANPAGALFSDSRYPATRYFAGQPPAQSPMNPGVIGKHPEN